MNKNFFLSLLFFCGIVPVSKAQLPQTLTDRLQFVVDSVSSKYNIKGVSAAVLVPGAGTWKGTYGYSHGNVKLTPDMLFCMGSNTKTHVAALLLKLQEMGKVNLNDTIGKWIIGYPYIKGKVTIRQCLNHTSGISDYFANAAINDSILGNPAKIWTEDELLRMINAPMFEPGSSWSYSNTNYIILGIIIRDVAQENQFVALDQYILKPNGLTQTYNFGEQPQSLVYAHPWTMNLTGTSLTDITTSPYLDQLFSMAITAGGLMTTAEENVHFWDKLFSGQMISQVSLAEMTTMRKISANMEYGLGIMRRKNTNNRLVYEHGGTFFGFLHENMREIASGVCISVLSNQDSVNNGGLQELYVVNLHREIINSGVAGISRENVARLQVAVYPNPAVSFLNIETEEIAGILTAELFDIQGKKVISQYMNESKTTLDVSAISQGIYFLKLKNEKGELMFSDKIMIGQ